MGANIYSYHCIFNPFISRIYILISPDKLKCSNAKKSNTMQIKMIDLICLYFNILFQPILFHSQFCHKKNISQVYNQNLENFKNVLKK